MRTMTRDELGDAILYLKQQFDADMHECAAQDMSRAWMLGEWGALLSQLRKPLREYYRLPLSTSTTVVTV